MYTEFFGLREPPFAITPDPRYLFMSERHREALAHLLYGASQGNGFVQLTGEVGTGKTTVTRVFLEQLPPEVDAALILNPRQSPLELLESIAEELHLPVPPGSTSKRLVGLLNSYLLESYAKGRRTVVVIDEAQNLSVPVLEQVRLLTNLETDRHKLLQIFLVGQPELRAVLARGEMRQLAQRITARYHLEPLNELETAAYIRHRLRVAGGAQGLFPPQTIRRIYRASGGIPRLINVICDRALLGAYARDSRQVTGAVVRMATREVAGEAWRAGARRRFEWRVALPAAAAGAALTALGFLGWPLLEPAPEARPAAEPAAEPATPTPPARTELLPIERTPPARTELTPIERAPQPAPAPPRLPLAERPAVEGRLLAAWGIQPGAGEELCARAALEGLRCYQGRGATLPQLRLLNRPVLVKLQEEGGEGWGLLGALSEEGARVDFGDEQRQLPAADLEARLAGEYLLLWRAPVDPKAIRTGSRGEPVAWLREALAQIDGQRLPPEPEPLLDTALQERVRAFQKARGLHVDGLAGEQTLLHLTTAINFPPAPTLGPAGNR